MSSNGKIVMVVLVDNIQDSAPFDLDQCPAGGILLLGPSA